MPASPGCAHNYHLQDRLLALKGVLNSNHYLRLFSNNITPTPDMTNAAFIEAIFPGYSPVLLTNDFGAPVQVAAGEFQISGTSHPFTFTAGTPQTVYGWYI